MPAAAPWSTRLAQDLITAEIAAARSFYGDDGDGATALLPILHALQHTFGHVPAESVPLLAERLNISKADVRGACCSISQSFSRARPQRPFQTRRC